MTTQKLWGGRFDKGTAPMMTVFSDSLHFDQRLWATDIRGSQAYAEALVSASVLTSEECQILQEGLAKVAKEWEENTFQIQAGDEDIHTANERRLGELVGPVAGKLHTGRSRNDQVVTDLRLWLRDEIDDLREHLTKAIRVMIAKAETYIHILMPGFTHMQVAQPTRFSHWLLSHAWALQRDLTRLIQIRSRVNVLPLGSGALVGNPFPIDRRRLADQLGFDDITHNSTDAVADRDFVAEFLFCASLSMVHLSQLAEDVIVYCSQPYGFMQLGDEYSTGSSLMPQKKNPDSFELIRGKSGRTLGALTGLMMTLKGLPRAYNRDLQEDKESLFDAVDTWSSALQIATSALLSLNCDSDAMAAAMHDHMLATDVAEYLVRRGVPFREAHHVAGQAVKQSDQAGCKLADLSLDAWQTLHDQFDESIAGVFDMQASVESRDVSGATSRRAIKEQVQMLKLRLGNPTAFCVE